MLDKLIEFITDWKQKNIVNTDLNEEQTMKFVREFQELLNQFSFKDPLGRNIIPYNGMVDDLPVFRLADAVSQSNLGYFYISDIEVGNILNDDEIWEAMRNVFNGKIEIVEEIFNGKTVDAVRTPYGVGDVLSLNDFISQKIMAANAKGNVFTITQASTPNSVWTLTELPELLRNENVTHIQGIKKSELLELYQMPDGLEKVRHTISTQAEMDWRNIHYSTDIDIESGKPFVRSIDTDDLIDYWKYSKYLEKNNLSATVSKWDDILETSKIEYELNTFLKRKHNKSVIVSWADDVLPTTGTTISGNDFLRMRDQVDDALTKTGYWIKHGKAGKILAIAGVIADVFEFGFSLKNAVDTFNETGDASQAFEHVKDWVWSSAGGWGLGTVGFSLAMTLIGGPIGFVIGLGTGFLGSVIGETFGDMLGDWWNNLFGVAQAATVSDPLILDLAGDGFNILNKKDGTFFDLDSNGFREKINWTRQDGILALDLDQNNQIDNGREVFGNYTQLANGKLAQNGFEALAQYDLNKDGVIDQQDPIFDQLLIWLDNDGDGTSTAQELAKLSDLGIASISLDFETKNLGTSTEAIIGNATTFTFEDGKVADIGELWVSSDFYNSKEVETVSGFEFLPNITSVGNIPSLHVAMSKNTSVKELVESFINQQDIAIRKGITEELMIELASATELAIDSRGSHMNARHLTVVEAFMGSAFNGRNGKNPNQTAALLLKKMYQNFVELYYSSLMSETVLKPYLLLVRENQGFYDLSLLTLFLDEQLSKVAIDIQVLSELSNYFYYKDVELDNNYGMFSQFRSYFTKEKAYLEAVERGVFSSDNDRVNGKDEKNWLFGGLGKDILSGGAGDDILDGGTDDDYLLGGAGNDVYLFGRGYGVDRINDYQGISTIRFLGDITLADISAYDSSQYARILKINGTGDQLILEYYRDLKERQNYELEFSDGTKVPIAAPGGIFSRYNGEEGDTNYTALADIDTHIKGNGGNDTLTGLKGNDILEGGIGDDKISGGEGNDILTGEEGNDRLSGDAGDDILDGGSGDDQLLGGAGNDVYLFGRGYGVDRINDYQGNNMIRFTEDIRLGNIEVTRSGRYDIKLSIKGESDQLVLKDFIYSSEYQNFKLEFFDGSQGEIKLKDDKISLDEISRPIASFESIIYLDQINEVLVSFDPNSKNQEISSQIDSTVLAQAEQIKQAMSSFTLNSDMINLTSSIDFGESELARNIMGQTWIQS